MRKLSAVMERALQKLRDDYRADEDPASSYSLRESLSTLEALRRRGLVLRYDPPGSSFSPHTSIRWRIKP